MLALATTKKGERGRRGEDAVGDNQERGKEGGGRGRGCAGAGETGKVKGRRGRRSEAPAAPAGEEGRKIYRSDAALAAGRKGEGCK